MAPIQKTLNNWLIVGLGPGGLDIWDPPYDGPLWKGLLLYWGTLMKFQTTGPKTNN